MEGYSGNVRGIEVFLTPQTVKPHQQTKRTSLQELKKESILLRCFKIEIVTEKTK